MGSRKISHERYGINRYLYAVATVEDPKYVKFGIAKHPKKRFSGIQSCCPVELRLEAFVPHIPGLEARILEHFKHFSVRGEWFTGSDEILRAVEIMKGGDVHLLDDYAESVYFDFSPTS